MCPHFGSEVHEFYYMLPWALALIAGALTWILLLLAAWRLMKAHEKIAKSLGEIASKQLPKQ